jgi:hypothetical protein
MTQPDGQLKEYLDEIHARYGVRVGVPRFSNILKDLGITYKMVRIPSLPANNSLQKKLHNKTKSSELPGRPRWHNGALSKWFSWTNQELIRDPEHELTDGAPKAALFRIPSSFRIVGTSVFFLQ